MLDIVASYYCMQVQGKLINQTCESGKKPSFGPDSSPFAEIRAANFFFKNMAPSVTGCHGQLSSCAASEKN